MASPSSPNQQGMRSRILSMVWTSLVLGLLLLGLGFWSVTQLSSLREQESKLLQGQLFLTQFSHQTKLLGLVAAKSLLTPDRSKGAFDIATESLKEYQDFERFYVDHKQALLELGSDLGKLDESKQFNSMMDGMLLSLRNAIQSMRDKNAVDPSLANQGAEWERSYQFTDQLLRGLSSHTAQQYETTTELLRRKSVALTYINLAAAAIFLVALFVLGITIANNIHRDSILASDKVTQNFVSMSHTLADLSRAGHTLATASSLHNGKINETLDFLKNSQTLLSRMRSESLASEQCSLETCLTMDEGSAAIGRATKSVQTARETSPVLNQLLDVLAVLQKRMTELQHIASRTQMLSYNASIEAARAGEHGRGFAVVALELSRVADMGTKATDEMAKALETSTMATVQSIGGFSLAIDDLATANAVANEQLEKMAHMARATYHKISIVKDQLLDHTKEVDSCYASLTAVQSTANSKEDVLRGLSGLSDILNHQAVELTATFDHMRVLLHGSKALKGASADASKSVLRKDLADKMTPSLEQEKTVASQALSDQSLVEPMPSTDSRMIASDVSHDLVAPANDPLQSSGDQNLRKSA